MRITWVTRSFLDYRISVYSALDKLCGHGLTVVYNCEVVSPQLNDKIKGLLGDRAIGLSGEWRLGGRKIDNASMANSGIRIPFQSGLLGIINKLSPEVMLSDGFMQWTYAPLFKRFMDGTPHVMCYERTAYTERHCQFYRKLYRKMTLRYIDAICCNGILCGDYVKSLGYPDDRLFYKQMAADTEGMSAMASNVKDAALVDWKNANNILGTMFVYVGQIIPRKGIRPLLSAWKSFVSTEKKPCYLVIIGEGCELEELKSWTIANGLDSVVWLGKKSYGDIPFFYKAADLFIIPTLEDNWSLVVPEAMACGLPVACSKYNGCHPELVRPENGWVFDPLDQDGTVRMLQEVMANSARLPAMGEASRRIVAEYTPRHAAESIYQACLQATKK